MNGQIWSSYRRPPIYFKPQTVRRSWGLEGKGEKRRPSPSDHGAVNYLIDPLLLGGVDIGSFVVYQDTNQRQAAIRQIKMLTLSSSSPLW